MKRMKKWGALVLALSLLLAALPVFPVGAETVDSGVCGENLTWVLDDEGTLTISGTGEMEDYDYDFAAPWQDLDVFKVVIEKGVTSIGNDAFGMCYALSEVTIPESVTRIGDTAFSSCTELAELAIPDSVTRIGFGIVYGTAYYTDDANWEGDALYIGNHLIDVNQNITGEYAVKPGTKTIADNVFEDCTGLTGITIPDGVTSIGEYAFYNCTGLAEITLPDSVTDIGLYAFSGTAYHEEDANWEDGVLYIGNHLVHTISPEVVGEYVVKPGTRTIADFAFAFCGELTKVTIPESVTRIGDIAFYSCISLTNATLLQGVTHIGDSAFGNCNSLEAMPLPESVESIGDDAFSDCMLLQDITIPAGVTSIGKRIFKGCSGLKTITVDENNPAYVSVDGVLFNKDKTTLICYPGSRAGDYAIPDGVMSIDASAFDSCTLLENVTIPDSVQRIGDGAFVYCITLEDVVIPASVQSIGDDVFYGCPGLKAITVDENNPAYASVDGILFNKDKTLLICCPGGWTGECTIPDGVTVIQDNAFYNCEGLTGVTIPASVTTIGEQAFYMCSGLTDVVIPQGVWNIGESAFAYCFALTKAVIPASVQEIGSYAFRSCEELTDVTIQDGVKKIGHWAFYECSSLEAVTIPASVTAIGDMAFGYGKFGDAIPGFTITGYRGTEAQVYAQENEMAFASAEELDIARAQEKVDCGLYTSESVAALQAAIRDLEAVLADTSATRQEIALRLAALETAMDGLVLNYPDVVWGDVDGKEGVTASDALMVLQAATGKVTLDEKEQAAANVDGKGGVTSADALAVLQYATQKITSFPVEG